MKTVLGIIWLVITWRLLVMKEEELRSEALLSSGGSNWYRVWLNAYVEGAREGEDFVDVLADDARTAAVIAAPFLNASKVNGLVASLMGTADLYRMMDAILNIDYGPAAGSELDLNDRVTPVRKK